jgi:hypothetical protein
MLVNAVIDTPELYMLLSGFSLIELGRSKKCLAALGGTTSARAEERQESAARALYEHCASPCLDVLDETIRGTAGMTELIACTDKNGPDILFTGSLAQERTQFDNPVEYLVLRTSLDALAAKMKGDTKAEAVWQRMQSVAPMIAKEMKPATPEVPSTPPE